MRTSPTVRFLRDRQGLNVAWAAHGEGPPLVCPSWWVSHLEQDWDNPAFRAFFECLGEVATVVRYDRPGMGLSDPSTADRDLDDEVALLDAVIAEAGAGMVSLLGISSGGPPAVRWAAEHPDRVDNLVLFGSYARGGDVAPVELQEALCGLVRAHWGAGARALADVFAPDATPEERDAFTRLQRTSTDAVNAERFLRLTYAMDVSEWLGDVRAHTVVLHRRGDRAMPFDAGRALAAGIPGATLVALEGRSHPVWMGDDVARPIADILRGRAPTVPSGECHLDHANRELVRDGERVPLTPLELGVMRYLLNHPGQVVTRDVLIHRVWEQRTSGSNVVDAVVAGLRRKLGRWAPSIETVTGHGYRFTRWISR